MDMHRRTAAIVIAACTMTVAVAAACGSDAEEASPATSGAPPVSVSPPTTTAIATTTTAVVTTAPPTTSPPTPTTLDLATLQAEVEADYREAVAAFRRAQQDPTNPQLVTEALSWRTGSSQQRLADLLGSMASGNERILPEPLAEPTITVEVPAVISPTDGELVELTTCDLDPWVLVEIGTGPGGSDAVIDDNIYAYRNVTRLRLQNSRWVIDEGIEIGTWVGATSCDAY
jgi:hypothetical protein